MTSVPCYATVVAVDSDSEFEIISLSYLLTYSYEEIMQHLSKSQRARYAIRSFKILADSLTLQGSYKPSGKIGEKMSETLRQLSPEIYGTMADPRITELKGLEYVVDRMPRGIENCTRIILTAQEDFQTTSFEKIVPRKRRRVSYAVSESELCFVITTGMSEIYDILTHITFLNLEAHKIYQQVYNRVDGISNEWSELERVVKKKTALTGAALEQAIWNLSIILGRTYKETKQTYDYLEKCRLEENTNNGLFPIIYGIGRRVILEQESSENELTVYFTPSLQEVISHHKYAQRWSESVKQLLYQLQLHEAPIHLVSANMHSVRNILYGSGALREAGDQVPQDLYEMVRVIRDKEIDVDGFAQKYGFNYLADYSGSNIDVNIIDLASIDENDLHPSLRVNFEYVKEKRPVIVVIDYAFGTQAFDIMDEFLQPVERAGITYSIPVE